MLRSTRWIVIVVLAAATGCKKKAARPPVDAAVPTDAPAAPAPPPERSKLDAAARIKGDIHAPPVDDGQPKKRPRDATGTEKRR